ncbi:unnamed protein product [Rangifer tarandus platyrhynchus]|uniref:Collagen alpha-1(I) chain-like n=1 Tax=Rangifer tarandus platyrhynchus TaxID=3082113 RepID=A0ABN8ZPQ3_RANTA|nr:unnamed protein product [Rangifer tarandus platyrhynchus]
MGGAGKPEHRRTAYTVKSCCEIVFTPHQSAWWFGKEWKESIAPATNLPKLQILNDFPSPAFRESLAERAPGVRQDRSISAHPPCGRNFGPRTYRGHGCEGACVSECACVRVRECARPCARAHRAVGQTQSELRSALAPRRAGTRTQPGPVRGGRDSSHSERSSQEARGSGRGHGYHLPLRTLGGTSRRPLGSRTPGRSGAGCGGPQSGGFPPTQPSSRGTGGLASTARCCGERSAGEAHAGRECNAAPPPGPTLIPLLARDPTGWSSQARALDGRSQNLSPDSESWVAEGSRASLQQMPSSRETDPLTLLSPEAPRARGGRLFGRPRLQGQAAEVKLYPDGPGRGASRKSSPKWLAQELRSARPGRGPGETRREHLLCAPFLAARVSVRPWRPRAASLGPGPHPSLEQLHARVPCGRSGGSLSDS